MPGPGRIRGPAAKGRPRWDQAVLRPGRSAAMIYSSYFLTYTSRMHMYKLGFWTEAGNSSTDLQLAISRPSPDRPGRCPLSAWLMIRRCDTRRGLPTLVGTAVGLVMPAVQARAEAPSGTGLAPAGPKGDFQGLAPRPTAREGIPREQLLGIFDPAYRLWNASVRPTARMPSTS